MLVKFPDLYIDPYRNQKPLFEESFSAADSNGKYYSFAGGVDVRVTPICLYLGNEIIPLAKVLEVKRHGNGISVAFLNRFNVVEIISFVKTGILSNSDKIYGIFLNILKDALKKDEDRHGKERLAVYQVPAPEDTCSKCGVAGAEGVNFSRVISIVHIILTRNVSRVLCKKHSTEEGMKYLLLTGFLGWFGLGLIAMPFAQVRNVRSLTRHSTLNGALVFLLALVSLLPAGLLAYSLYKTR